MTTKRTRTALVIGARGGVGSETMAALIAHGWDVRPFKGDAMDAAAVRAAAEGVDVIVHAVNPPGYRNWKGLALPMLENTIAAAKATGARIVLPGTVYNFGPDVFPRVDESAAQNPRTRKGAIRVQMETALESSGCPVLIVRAGDFFGPRAKNSWFSQGLLKPGQPLKWLMYPGRPEALHQWAYLPDLAETIAQLLDRSSELERFAVFHFRGHVFERGIEIAEVVRRVANAPHARIWPFPWFATYLIAPFNETFREMIEMRYLWKQPLEMTNEKLVAFLGEEPHTPLDRALEATLRGLGVYDRSDARPATAVHVRG